MQNNCSAIATLTGEPSRDVAWMPSCGTGGRLLFGEQCSMSAGFDSCSPSIAAELRVEWLVCLCFAYCLNRVQQGSVHA